MKSEQIKEITDRAAEQLVAALQAGHSEALTAYLKAIGRFHRYSLLNVLLIASQKPNASYVAGFRTWNELGRFVKKGEKGIMILAPIIRRKAQNDDEERDENFRPIAGFRAAFVFDISQTMGTNFRRSASFRVILLSTPAGCVDLPPRRASASNIPRRSRPLVERPTAAVLRFCPASQRPRNSLPLCMNWRTSCFIATNADL
jgi:hypothetical protein